MRHDATNQFESLMRISLFGRLRIRFAGRPVTAVNTNRLQSLIAYLILHGDAPQPRERLAFTLWQASSESQADGSTATSPQVETSIADKVLREPKRIIRVWFQDRSHDMENEKYGSWPQTNIRHTGEQTISI